MERHYYLTMRYIVKDVNRSVGAPEHFTSAVVSSKYCIFKRILSYYISCLLENLKISCHRNINRMTTKNYQLLVEVRLD